MEVASFLGISVPMGSIAAFVVQILKRTPWVPVFEGQPARLRIVVAVISLGLNLLAMYLAGEPLDLSVLGQTFVSYVTAAAAYDHVLR